MITAVFNGIAGLLIGVSGFLLKAPSGYLPINQRENRHHSSLWILSLFIDVVSLLQISVCVFSVLYFENESNNLVDLSFTIAYWLLVLVYGFNLSQTTNLESSLYALFLSLVLNTGALGYSVYTSVPYQGISQLGLREQILCSQLLFSTFLVCVDGLWSTRDEENDDENISKEQGCSIISMLFYNWLTPLIKIGGSKSLETKDLWKMIDADSSEKVLMEYQQFNGSYSLARKLFFAARRAGTRTRIVIVEELYQKSLRRVQGVSNNETENASLGKIVTLMSVDTNKIRNFLAYSHDCLTGMPLSVIISITSLYLVLGWSAFVGVALIIVLSPLSSYAGKAIVKYQEECLKNTDARVAIMNEVLQGIRIIKYFAWEKYFAKKVEAARHKELMSGIALWASNIGIHSIATGSGIVVAFSTFAVYTFIEGKSLDTATAFTAVNLLNTTTDVLASLPYRIMDIFRAKVSLERIQGYLDEPELDRFEEEKAEDSISDNGTESDFTFGFRNAEYVYHGTKTVCSSDSSFSLKNINAEFPLQSLTVVCGPTGSGKTSLLLALLGEMKKVKGQVSFPMLVGTKYECGKRSIAYSAQTAWILNTTIRENITFGHEYDPVRYERVVRACALAKDFENLDGGDLTEIGEKGINLSGGQKQRISLARACYSPASIVLLDDPLSAVDAPTARYLLHKCILGVLKGRTVILVSHATHLVVPFADYIVSMKNGEIVNQGAPIQLVQNPEDESLFGLDLTRDEFEDVEESKVSVITAAGNGTTLVEDEEKATGAVSWSVYRMYFKATGGIQMFLVFVIAFLFYVSLKVFNDWWLKYWTDSNATAPSLVSDQYRPLSPSILEYSSISWNVNQVGAIQRSTDSFYFISIYAMIGLFVVLASDLESIVTYIGAYWASQKLHSQLLNSILGAPMRFFETTPIGRILNRFSKDLDYIDSAVMDMLHFYLDRVFNTIIIIIVVGSIAPVFLIAIPPISLAFIYVTQRYLSSSRELKRLESVSTSPTYAQFSETLAGTSTIRAYAAEERFSAMIRKRVDDNHQPYYHVWSANRWLCIRTDMMSTLIVFSAGLAVVFSDIPAGWAAVCITYALDFSRSLLLCVRLQAEVEMAMNSVERVEEYCKIEQEPPAIIESNRPDPNWPSKGSIQVKELSVRYAPNLPNVLNGVSFSIQPREKVAVVGRTGAGKSTLSLAFFRIIPLSGGSITIDGIDIGEIGLFDLRSRLTIIPQDPVLFTGTLRTNLDPLEQNDDQTLWEALKRVHFLESMQSSSTDLTFARQESFETEVADSTITLDYAVTENGGNFSQGQRQLLCLARSLIQRNKVIFLDEATASVDNETDAKIQGTIRSEFADSTIICIAHRLRTVIDYDKVLVLDKGQVLEYGSPLELIHNSKTGVFRSMCEETGEFEELLEM
ncbi:hypothetical protein HDV06_003159, partial [Boothiomyces sp. JEL0866]